MGPTSLGSHRYKYEDKITMHLKRVRSEDLCWIQLAQDNFHFWNLTATTRKSQFS